MKKYLIFALAFAARAVLIGTGYVLHIFIVPLGKTPHFLKWYGEVHGAWIPDEYNKSLWKKYVWVAWRNPTNGLKGIWEQPALEERPNPDEIVRKTAATSASRFMENGIYWEYWYLREIDWTIFGKHYKWFEVRIGWKYVDGNDEFFPTIQCAPHSS